MRFSYYYLYGLIVGLVFMVALVKPSTAQINIPYSINTLSLSSGNAGDINYSIMNNSGCIRLMSGIGLFIKTNADIKFSKACFENITANQLCQFPLYPNPAAHYVMISAANCLHLQNNEWVYLQINNEWGQVLETKKIQGSALLSGLKIDIARYTAGKYFVSIIADNQIHTLKILKMYAN